jgi:Flp pilus assembly protein TadD
MFGHIRTSHPTIYPAICLFWLSAAALFVTGCTGLKPSASAEAVTPDELLSGVALGVNISSPVVDNDILTPSPEMIAFIEEYVDRNGNDYIKLHQLVYAIISEGTFGLEYTEQTQTAAGTFRDRSGNCLSFTNMFVAMARNAGLSVSFQEVDIPPDWEFEGDTFVLNRHVNVNVDLGKAGEHVVDFNIEDFRSSYDMRKISDERALAHFYNNKGVGQMQNDESISAFRFLRLALRYDSTFAPTWSNLGALYSRAGHTSFAEASYLQALRLNRTEYVAMSNLARLYESRGDQERAAYYRDRVHYHRMRNPYFRYQLAQQAFLARDYETAIGHLKFAIREKEWEDNFYLLLGLSYMQLGDEKKARRWLLKAEEVADSDVLKTRYRNKLELLLSTAPVD